MFRLLTVLRNAKARATFLQTIHRNKKLSFKWWVNLDLASANLNLQNSYKLPGNWLMSGTVGSS